MPSADRKYGVPVRIEEDSKELLIKLTQRYGKDMKIILGTLIDMCDQHDLLKKGWEKRLTAALKKGRREIENLKFEEDADRCPAIVKGAEKYKCVWGRREKPPTIKILEKEYEASKELCFGCKRTLAINEQNREYLRQIQQLEFNLKAKSEMTYKVPICGDVGRLNEDATIFTSCRENNGNAVYIEEFCKVKNEGEPCKWYTESIVGVGRKIKRRY